MRLIDVEGGLSPIEGGATNAELYRLADEVLAEFEATYAVSKQAQRIGVASALGDMFRIKETVRGDAPEDNGFFNASLVRRCAELTGVVIPADRLAFYGVAHSMEWRAMQREHAELLRAMVLDDFRSVFNSNDGKEDEFPF